MKVFKGLILFLGLFVSTNVFASETMQCNFGVELERRGYEKIKIYKKVEWKICSVCS